MKNSRSYSSYYGNDEKYKINEFKDIPVELTILDKMRFRQFIKEEGNYYNNIISVVSPYIRTSRDWLLEVFDKKKDVFEKLSNSTVLLNSLKISEKEKYVMKGVVNAANIIPDMKKNITSEMISYYIRTIKEMNSSVGMTGDIVYSRPIELLHPVDTHLKNSFQIQKSMLKMEYSNELKATKVWMPYSSSFIVIPNTNLIKDKNWNILIVKFNYNKKNEELWTVSTKKTPSKYILKQSTVTSKK